jgi:hypothetical protein
LVVYPIKIDEIGKVKKKNLKRGCIRIDFGEGKLCLDKPCHNEYL